MNTNLIKYILFFFIILISLNYVTSLHIDMESRYRCVKMSNTNLYLDIQLYPEFDSIFICTYNPNNFTIKNMSFKIHITGKDNKIFATLPHDFSSITPNQFACQKNHKLKFQYNAPLNLYLFDLKIDDEENFYNIPLFKEFKEQKEEIILHKCLDIINWNRETNYDFYMNKKVKEEIILRKYCDGEISLNLFYDNIDNPYIPIKESKLIYKDEEIFLESFSISKKDLSEKTIHIEDRTIKIFLPESKEKTIKIILPETVPKNDILKLILVYYLPNQLKKQKTIFYPFTNWFYDLNTGEISLKDVYLNFNNTKRQENITHIKLYTNDIILPKGYPCYNKPNLPIKNEDNTKSPYYVFPNQKCLRSNETFFPMLDILTIPIPREINMISETSDYGKIIWSSPIVDGRPTGLNFELKEPPLFKLVYVIFLIVSLIFILIFFKQIIIYISLYLLLRLALPIPYIFTLFDFTTILSLIIAIVRIYLMGNKKDDKELLDYVRIKIKKWIR